MLDETRAGLRGPGVGDVALVAPKNSLLFVASFTMTSEKGSIVAAVSELCSGTTTAGDTKYSKGRRRELSAGKVGEKASADEDLRDGQNHTNCVTELCVLEATLQGDGVASHAFFLFSFLPFFFKIIFSRQNSLLVSKY